MLRKEAAPKESASERRSSTTSQQQSSSETHPDSGSTESGPVTAMLDRVDRLADSQRTDPVGLGETLDAAGHHSFAPVLLVLGLIMVVPGPADIPGVPIALGLLVIITSVQILMRREHVWVPAWMERWTIAPHRLRKMVHWLRRPARWSDRITRPRWTWLVEQAGASIIAVACILIALATPVLEFVPFSANVAGAAIAAFALALVARDGLVGGVATALSIATAAIVAYQLLS